MVENSINVEASSRVSKRRVVSTKRYLRVLPMIMAGLYLTNTVLSSFDIDYRIFSYIAHILSWWLILKSSYLFGFCSYHRMFLWYVIVNDAINIVDYEFVLPINDREFLALHIIIAGIFLFLVLYFRLKCSNR